MNLNEIDTNQYLAELQELENEPLAEIKLHPIAAIAVIGHVQLACRNPEINRCSEFNKIAIGTAKKLQTLFNPNSTTYKVLSMGWNPEHDGPEIKI